MEGQRKLCQPLAHRVPGTSGICFVLEADNEVVGIAHDNNIARGLLPSPAIGPQIENVVQIDIGQKGRDDCSLPAPSVTDRHDPIFQDACLEPFADQADDAQVADTVFDESDQPFLVDRVEERLDVGV